MTDWTDRLKSRKFLLAVFGVAFAFLTDVLGIAISAETWTTVTTLILGFIAAEGTADIVERLKAKK